MIASRPASRAVEDRARALPETYWPSYRASRAGLLHGTAIRRAIPEGPPIRSPRYGTSTADTPPPFASSPTCPSAFGFVRVEPVDILAISAAAEAVLQHRHEGSTARGFSRRGDAQRHAPRGRRLIRTVHGSMAQTPLASFGCRKTGTTRPCAWRGRFKRRQAVLCRALPFAGAWPCD